MNAKDFDITTLRESLATWLESMAVDLDPGRFRFCGEGSLVPTGTHAGQMATCFAMRIAWQTGLWEMWSPERRSGCIAFLQSFQNQSGYFQDPWVSGIPALLGRSLSKLILRKISPREVAGIRTDLLRAETRQTATCLMMVDSRPLRHLPMELTSEEEVSLFIHNLNWRQPWAAASHAGHQIFFLSANRTLFGKPENAAQLLERLLGEIAHYHHADTGTWHSGDPSPEYRINGAMKIWSGLQWLDRPPPDCRALLDYALAQPWSWNGCSFLNRLLVVRHAQTGVPQGYRREEILAIARSVLSEVSRFAKPDGGFSFNPQSSQIYYYGVPTSKGLPVSDLHGTMLLVWAVATALGMLGEEKPAWGARWREQKN